MYHQCVVTYFRSISPSIAPSSWLLKLRFTLLLMALSRSYPVNVFRVVRFRRMPSSIYFRLTSTLETLPSIDAS